MVNPEILKHVGRSCQDPDVSAGNHSSVCIMLSLQSINVFLCSTVGVAAAMEPRNR